MLLGTGIIINAYCEAKKIQTKEEREKILAEYMDVKSKTHEEVNTWLKEETC